MAKAVWCHALVLAVAAVAAASPAAAQQAPSGPTYYIAADQVQWNYAPSGVNLCNGEQFSGDPMLWTTIGVGSVYKKAQYRQYTDDTFQTVQGKSADEEHTGILGPIIRAAVGQVLTVVLKNNLDFPINLEPAGVQVYSPAGANAAAELSPAVQPGGTVTYRWTVPQSMGPAELEPSAKMWLYRSTVDMLRDANAGLVGPMLISNTPEVNTGVVADGQERDIITVLQILDENSSPYLEQNVAGRTPAEMGVSDDGLIEGNLKHAINGYLYCNAPGMVMTQGEKVRWHMASVGSETDMHNLHLHGNTFLNNGHRADHLSMIPGTARSLQFSTENAGFWLMHCHVGDHINAGMKAMYMVKQDAAKPQLSGVQASGTVRKYYIEAEEDEWDYTPLGHGFCSGTPEDWTPEQAVFTVANEYSLGSKFTKARYIEYTDDTFTTQKAISADDAYLGLLGPIIRAEVGDTIEVVFKNSARFPTTLHPHGVAYLKNSEGSPYFDGTMGADTDDDGVATGETHTYVWQVPASSGPGPKDPSTLLWMYHSHTNEVADVYAGLVGALVIGRKGELKPDLTGKDVDREVVLFFMVVNEVHSLFADVNAAAMGFTTITAWEAVAEAAFGAQSASDQALAIQSEQMARLTSSLNASTAAPATSQTLAAAPAPAQAAAAAGMAAVAGRRRLLSSDEGYEEPMLKHIINGYLYCNMPVLTFSQGQTVRFHVMALGSEVDLHTPNFVGQSIEMDEQRNAAMGMMAGAMHSVDVVMGNPGTAVVQCRIADHIGAGMQALINVTTSEALSSEQEAAAAAAPVNRYYIAAEEVQWDYVPLGLDGCTNSSFGPDAELYVARTNTTIGSEYTKAVYRQYTDDTYTKQVEQSESHGILGPTLVAEVGQTLELVFRNNLDFEVNIQLDGGLELLAGSAGEGGQGGAPVAPGASATYRYYVPESAGPAAEDLSTVAYTYTSSVDLVAHPHAGLIGVVMVAAPGALQGSGVPTGVDGVVPLLFTIVNEGASPYLQQNMEAAGLGVEATYAPDFGESNSKHSINGYLYCNLPGLTAKAGSTTRFLLVGMGSELDLHSPVFTGQVLQSKTAAYQTAELMPTVTRVVDVSMQQAGSWPVYCAVHTHNIAGMRATLLVQ